MCTLVRPEDSPIQMMCDQTRRWRENGAQVGIGMTHLRVFLLRILTLVLRMRATWPHPSLVLVKICALVKIYSLIPARVLERAVSLPAYCTCMWQQWGYFWPGSSVFFCGVTELIPLLCTWLFHIYPWIFLSTITLRWLRVLSLDFHGGWNGSSRARTASKAEGSGSLRAY